MSTVWNIAERLDGNVVVIQASVRGLSLEPSAGGHRLLATIDERVRGGHNLILLNLKEAPYMDSDGLGEIVRGFTVTHRAGGQLGVCELVPKVRELFSITRLSAHIPIFESESEGVQNLGISPPSIA